MVQRRALVCGRFSSHTATPSASDLLAARFVSSWLTSRGIDHDVAWARGRTGGRSIDDFPASSYTDLVVVGDPPDTANGQDVLTTFEHAHRIGIGAHLDPSGFDAVLGRGRDGAEQPDLSFRSVTERIPLIGVDAVVDDHVPPALLGEALRDVPVAILTVGTEVRADAAPPGTAARDPAGVVSLLARIDALVTSSVDGLVLALAAGTPAVGLVPQGDPLLIQARALGWPWAYDLQEVRASDTRAAIEEALGSTARRTVHEVVHCARIEFAETDRALAAAVGATNAQRRSA